MNPAQSDLAIQPGQALNLIHSFIQGVIGDDFEIRSDSDTIYIYHPLKVQQALLHDDRVLFALYGILFSTGMRAIHIQDFALLTQDMLKKQLQLVKKV